MSSLTQRPGSGTDIRRASSWLAATAAAVPILSLVAVLAFIGLEVGGASPLTLAPRNIAEAAAYGDAADVRRLLQEGADPNAIVAVRPEFISSTVQRASTVEAAIWSRRVELVRMIDELRGISPVDRPRLACLAVDLGTTDIVAYLSPTGPPSCKSGAASEAIFERTRALDRAGRPPG